MGAGAVVAALGAVCIGLPVLEMLALGLGAADCSATWPPQPATSTVATTLIVTPARKEVDLSRLRDRGWLSASRGVSAERMSEVVISHPQRPHRRRLRALLSGCSCPV